MRTSPAVTFIAVVSLLVSVSAHAGGSDAGDKKESWFVTGLPIVNYSTDTGLGYGARIYLHDNGSKEDPRFVRSPYLAEFYVQYFNTTYGWQYDAISGDLPRLLGSPYRVRFLAAYDKNTNKNYFGPDSATLAPLAGGNYASYQRALDQNEPLGSGSTNGWFDKYILTRPGGILQLERDLGRNFRAMAGFNADSTRIGTYDGRRVRSNNADRVQGQTRLDRDRPSGIAGGWVNLVRAGVAWDTRDFEPAPGNGWLLDLDGEFSSPALGSGYSFTRETLTVRRYQPVLGPVLAAVRAVISGVQGDPPFFETSTLSFMEYRKGGLGGGWTLPGFKDSRFSGRITSLVNLEVRMNAYEASPFAGQHFLFTPVVMAAFGRVFDRASELGLSRWKDSSGAALRIAWNQSTILNISWSMSAEDSGVFVDFGHPF
jgi:hypothetical protein